RAPRVAVVLLLLGVALLGGSFATYRALRWGEEARAPDGANGTAVSRERQRPENEPWQPRPPLTPEELAKLPSPLDALKREAMGLPENAPPELLALLGESPYFRMPGSWACHWMAQTSDGRLLAVPYGDNILLFEVHTGTLLRTLTGHTSRAYRPVFSPDGKRLASGEDKAIVRVWDVATGRVELTLTEHKHPVWSVDLDPEGKRLVSADAGGTVKVWDAKGQLVHSCQGHTKEVNHLAFSPDGKRLATASGDGTCKVWDTDNWQEVQSLPGSKTVSHAVAWSRDGKRLAAGDDAEVSV